MRLWPWAALALGLCACLPPSPTFDDHTVPRLDSVEDFDALAKVEFGRAQVKFIITDFQRPASRSVSFLESQFYTLHDEWYWFRLLNGQSIPGQEDLLPVAGHAFSSVADIYDWAQAQPSLPLDLTWVDGGRLYSPRFYALGLPEDGSPRGIGLGSVLRVPLAMGGARWVFLLEQLDRPTEQELQVFFDTLLTRLPAEVGAGLSWLVRSPAQESLANALEAGQSPLAGRVVRYADLSNPEAVEVYTPGLTAGRLRRVTDAAVALSDASPTDILLLEYPPDFLPPAAGLISATPQTPLSHLNVLAKNRGIPNAYWGSALSDLYVQELAWLRSPVLLSVEAPDGLTLKPITESQLRTYELLQGKAPVEVAPVDVSSLPYTYDLTSLPSSALSDLRSGAGGKSAGMLALWHLDMAGTVERPFAISIRAYAEHLAPLRSAVEQALADAEFQSSARVRSLALEGLVRYEQRFPTSADRLFKEDFLARRPPGTALGDLARTGGISGALKAREVAPATLAALEGALVAQFSSLSPTQGLRFRSSSTVEDIEGFNGAGLYDSNTGFLYPAQQTDPDEQRKSVAWALKETWASYWKFEAFEERRLEKVNHLSGNMGVLVHPRFDDSHELANGVFLFTLHPPGSSVESTLELNLQKGAQSVVNPTGEALPEVTVVSAPRGLPLELSRVRASTLSPDAPLISDEALTALVGRARAVAQGWLQVHNADLAPERKARSITLDFELRHVAQGWPATVSGPPLPERWVLKQVRPLEPGLRRLPPAAQALPAPVDLLSRARRAVVQRCSSSALTLSVTQVWTDSLLPPEMGHSEAPFIAAIEAQFHEAQPTLGKAAGDAVGFVHLELSVALSTAPWSVDASVEGMAAQTQGLRRLAFGESGGFLLESEGGAVLQGQGLACLPNVLFSGAREYLQTLL